MDKILKLCCLIIISTTTTIIIRVDYTIYYFLIFYLVTVDCALTTLDYKLQPSMKFRISLYRLSYLATVAVQHLTRCT